MRTPPQMRVPVCLVLANVCPAGKRLHTNVHEHSAGYSHVGTERERRQMMWSFLMGGRATGGKVSQPEDLFALGCATSVCQTCRRKEIRTDSYGFLWIYPGMHVSIPVCVSQ